MDKKRYIGIILAIALSLVMLGCAAGQKDVEISEKRGQSASLEFTDQKDETIDDDAVPTTSEPGMNKTEDIRTSESSVDKKELYAKFLANEETVFIQSYRLFGSLHDILFDKNKYEQDFLLSEIVQKILGEDSELYVKEIKYAYINPMDEGAEQLLVLITTDWGDLESSSGQSYTDYKLVVNYVDGKLILLYENEDIFRYAVTINKYGYISTGSYSGLASDEYEYRILTEDGWKFVYGESFEADNYLTPLTVLQNEQMMEVNLETLRDDGGAAWIYRLEEEGDMDSLCSYAFWNDKGEPEYGPGVEEKLYGKDSPYRKAFEKAGVKFYTMSEIEKMVSQKEKEIGITDKIKNAEEPEWINVKAIAGIINASNKKQISKTKSDKIIELDSSILGYRNIRYSDFYNMTGNEAEFYHNCYFIASIPGTSYEIVFLGGWDDNTFEAFIDDDSLGYMLQGKLKDFAKSVSSEITLDKVKDDLVVVSYEYREGGGTIYYVSDNYVRLNIDSGSDGKADMFMDVAIDPARPNVISLDADVYLYWDEEPK